MKPAASVGRPRSETLLDPEWHQRLDAALAESALLRPGWQDDEGKDPDLRTPSALDLINEPQLCAEFGVTNAVLCRGAAGPIERSRDDGVQLQARQCAVVHFEVRERAGRGVALHRPLRPRIEFPMLHLDWLRIVREERRPGPTLVGDQYSCQREQQC